MLGSDGPLARRHRVFSVQAAAGETLAPSDHPQPTRDTQGLARHVRRLLGGQEGHRGRHLLGLAEAPRLGSPPSSSRRCPSPSSPSCVAPRRSSGVSIGPGAIAFAVIREAGVLARDRLRERDHAPLGRGVDGGALRADAAGLRGDADDAAVAGLLHGGEHGRGAGADAHEVDREHPPPSARGRSR